MFFCRIPICVWDSLMWACPFSCCSHFLFWSTQSRSPCNRQSQGWVFFSYSPLPIVLFIIVNTFQLNPIHIGPVTIPRLPVQARYEAMAAVFGNSPLRTMMENISIMLKLLWKQEDAFPWNYVKPFGYFYTITFPFALIGLFLTIPLKSSGEKKSRQWFVLAWMMASIAIGTIHPTNLTRPLKFIFTPILFCITLFILELDKRIKYSLNHFSSGIIHWICAIHSGISWRGISKTGKRCT